MAKFGAYTWYDMQGEDGAHVILRQVSTTHPSKPGWTHWVDQGGSGRWLKAITTPPRSHYPVGGQCYQTEAGFIFWTNAKALTGI